MVEKHLELRLLRYAKNFWLFFYSSSKNCLKLVLDTYNSKKLAEKT